MKGNQGRNLEAGDWSTLTGLLSQACSVCFLIKPRSWVALTTVGWTLLHQSLGKYPHRFKFPLPRFKSSWQNKIKPKPTQHKAWRDVECLRIWRHRNYQVEVRPIRVVETWECEVRGKRKQCFLCGSKDKEKVSKLQAGCHCWRSSCPWNSLLWCSRLPPVTLLSLILCSLVTGMHIS